MSDAEKERLLAYVADYGREHGRPPTVREVMTFLGLRSSSTAHKHIRRLQAEGLLEARSVASRTLRVTEAGRRRAGGLPHRLDVTPPLQHLPVFQTTEDLRAHYGL